jgi:hypothetical protein
MADLVLSALDDLLVQAALGSPDRARQAWAALQDGLDIGALDAGQQSLLPALHRNVRAFTPTHPTVGRLKGAYRRTWSQNQLLLREATVAVERLGGAGITTVLLKGAGLVCAGVHAIGVRPMRDVDVLVATAAAGRARAVLAADGWRPRLDPQVISLDHAQALTRDHGRGLDVDLHWEVSLDLRTRNGRHRADELWARQRPATIGTVSTATLAPTDHLLHTLVHGLRFHETRLVWILDTVALLDAGGIDWDLLVSEAEHRRVVLPVRRGLALLDERHIRPVPSEALARLASARVSRRDRVNHRLRAAPPPARLSPSQLALWRWAAANSHNGVLRATTTMPEFFRRYWELDREWQVPVQVLRFAVGRVRPRSGSREPAAPPSLPSG